MTPQRHLVEHAGVHERGPALAVRGIEIHRELLGVLAFAATAISFTANIATTFAVAAAAVAATISFAANSATALAVVADQRPQAAQVAVRRRRHDRRPPRRVRPRRLGPPVKPDRVENQFEGGEVAARRRQESRRPPAAGGDERVRPPGEQDPDAADAATGGGRAEGGGALDGISPDGVTAWGGRAGRRGRRVRVVGKRDR